MKRRKKLIGRNALDTISTLRALGVPMTKIHSRLGLDKVWSLTATRIIVMAEEAEEKGSTRPLWLRDEPLIQDAPANIVYEGIFPNGQWLTNER